MPKKRIAEPAWELDAPPGERITLEHAKKLHDIQSDLVRLSLNLTGHSEIWGALRAAGAAVEVCARIAHRDYEHYGRRKQV